MANEEEEISVEYATLERIVKHLQAEGEQAVANRKRWKDTDIPKMEQAIGKSIGLGIALTALAKEFPNEMDVLTSPE